jgi:hypothetical protein
MGPLALALGLSGLTLGRPHCPSMLSLGDLVPMVLNLIINANANYCTHLSYSSWEDTTFEGGCHKR